MENGGYKRSSSSRVQSQQSILANESRLDLNVLIDRAIDRFGRYQRLIVIILCINSVIVAINHTVTAFHVYTPANYTCIDDKSASLAANYSELSCVPGCTEYEFLDSDTSAVTEWDLICDRRYLSALINTIYFAGVTLGSFVCGVLADIYGRRKLVFACLYLQGVFAILLYFCNSLHFFMTLRFIQGFFVQGIQGVSYALLQEITPTRHLTLSGLTWEMFWVVGMTYLGSTAYFVRDWKIHQLILTIPTVCTLAWIWLIPESPSWNLTNHKRKSALQETLTIASRNNDESFFDELKKMQEASLGNAPKDRIQEEPAKMIDLFRNKILLKHIIVMIVVWYSVTVAYYGILLYTPNLPGGRHGNFLMGSAIEVVALTISFFILSSQFGRRFSMIGYQYVNTVFCFGLGILVLVPFAGEWVASATALIALVAKGIAVSAIGGMHIYGAELFPTVMRGSAIGILGFSARIGSLTASQIILLGELTHPFVSMLIMSILLFIGGCVTFLVPETLNKKLPDTLQDVDETWGKHKPNFEITKL